jgi:hypothetical protein
VTSSFKKTMRHLPLALTSALVLIGSAVPCGAQAYDLDLDSGASSFMFSGTTNVGPIVGTPNTFQIDGIAGLDLAFGCDGLPATGQLGGGDIVTIPNVLNGHVPNPIPIFPPLASVTITDMHVTFESTVFTVAPTGHFTATTTMVVQSGSVDFVPVIGDPGTLDLAGFTSSPDAVPGQVIVSPTGVRVVLDVDLDIPIDNPDAGVTGTVNFVGTADGTAPRIATFCDSSDGSLTSCPCSNPGSPDSGCEVPQGTGGVQLTVSGQSTTPLNRATLLGCGFPSMGSPTAIVIRAPSLEAAPVVFGDGLRCIGVPLVRLTPVFASGGASTHIVGHGAMAGIGSFHYQVWFRSTPMSYCDAAAAFNLSNGVSLTWP